MSSTATPTRDRSRVEQSLRFEDNIGLVHLQAKFGHKWAMSAGATSLDYQDLFQEASLAFLNAAEGFDPDKDVKFSAYYTKAAYSQFRKAIGMQTGVKNLNADQRGQIADRREENRRRGAAALPPLDDMNFGLRPVSMSELGYEDGDPFEDTLDSEVATPEQILERRQCFEQATANLSPLAQLMVDWLMEPPPEFADEIRAQQEHVEVRTKLGLRSPVAMRKGECIDNIGRFLQLVYPQLKEGQIALAKAELMAMIKQIEE